MPELYRLHGGIRHYDWGSRELIPNFLGIPGNGRPHAELWMGSHRSLPSFLELPAGRESLAELIDRDGAFWLGREMAERRGDLPFLFKLLAAERPLSIQAHPNREQAAEGFARENRDGPAPDDPKRNYRDANHKPELLCALDDFVGLCGFREPAETKMLVGDFLAGKGASKPAPQALTSGLAPLLAAIEGKGRGPVMRDFLSALFALSGETREALTDFLLGQDCREDGDSGNPDPAAPEWAMMKGFAGEFPGDRAVIAPLFLNAFRLRPGEAVAVGAGVLHAYVKGFALELMANSDNVLRGGLTGKHVDPGELLRVLDFGAAEPEILRPETGGSPFTYPSNFEEFSLSVIQGDGGSREFSPECPAICVVSEGRAEIGRETFLKGRGIYVRPGDSGPGKLDLRGSFTMYVATAGKPGR